MAASVRVSQAIVETLIALNGTGANVRVSQVIVELLTSNPQTAPAPAGQVQTTT